MSSLFSVIKVLLVPGVIALLLYVSLSFIIIPFWQRYRSRYSQYIPIGAISDRASGLRQRLRDRFGGGGGGLAQYLNPSTWRRDNELVVAGGGGDAGFDSDEGEELGHVNDDQLLQHSSRHSDTSNNRLSLDLEQGFIDDSSSDSD